MLRKKLIQNYVPDLDIYAVMGHASIIYLKLLAGYIVLLGILYVVVYLVQTYLTTHIYLARSAAAAGSILYLKCLYDLANEYLDCLVVSNRGLILFRRDGLFNYKTQYLQRISIESISEQTNSFRDTLFKKGDIRIIVEDEKYIFHDIDRPSTRIAELLRRKEKILGRYAYHENETPAEEAHDRYALLVEAIGEVVNEYVERKGEKRNDTDY